MFGRLSEQDIESAAEVGRRSSPRSLQRRPAHCLRRSYFSEYSFARFRLCFVRTAPTAGGTEQCLPIGVMRPFRRFRSCLSAACYTYSDGVFVETALKAMLLSLGRVFLAKQEACRPWGKGRFGSGEKRRCYTNQAQSHDSERKTLEVIQQQNSLRRRLFLYPC